MNGSLWRPLALLGVGVVLGFGLARTGGPRAPDASSEVVARVGGEAITRRDVEASAAGDFQRLDQERYELMRRQLEATLQLRLVELEAEAQGLTAEELLQREVEAYVDEPSDAEVQGFYDARGLQSRATLDELRTQIREYLTDQTRTARYTAFVTGLRERHGARNLLEPPRTEVASQGFPSRGPADASVTLVEFSDFQCPFCARFAPTLERILDAYPGQVRLVYRHMPIPSLHPHAQRAAEASMCADEQGAFWEMHDAMFADQRALGEDDLKSTARSLGLDGARFDECLDAGVYTERVSADARVGHELGIQGTPALFINGRFLSGAQPYQVVAQIVDEELERATRQNGWRP